MVLVEDIMEEEVVVLLQDHLEVSLVVEDVLAVAVLREDFKRDYCLFSFFCYSIFTLRGI